MGHFNPNFSSTDHFRGYIWPSKSNFERSKTITICAAIIGFLTEFELDMLPELLSLKGISQVIIILKLNIKKLNKKFNKINA